MKTILVTALHGEDVVIPVGKIVTADRRVRDPDMQEDHYNFSGCMIFLDTSNKYDRTFPTNMTLEEVRTLIEEAG